MSLLLLVNPKGSHSIPLFILRENALAALQNLDCTLHLVQEDITGRKIMSALHVVFNALYFTESMPEAYKSVVTKLKDHILFQLLEFTYESSYDGNAVKYSEEKQDTIHFIINRWLVSADGINGLLVVPAWVCLEGISRPSYKRTYNKPWLEDGS